MAKVTATPSMGTADSTPPTVTAKDGETEQKPYWTKIKDTETDTEYVQVSKAFLGPPLPDRPFEGMNALTFTRKEVERVYDNRHVMPGLLVADNDLVESKSDEESYPCKIVQITALQQFVLVDDDIFRITGCSLTGETDDSGQYYEVRIKCDFAKEVEDPELVAAVKELACKR